MPAVVEPLVTTEWLAAHLDDPGVRVVDMRGYVSTKPVGPGVEEATYRGAEQEYLAGHIPGAVYVDWTGDIIDPDDPVPAQIAPPDRFAEAMAVRGIGDDTHVVAVDHAGSQFATRLWWALNYYGHEKVSVLDGGYKRWLDEDRPLDEGPVEVPRAVFRPRVRPELRATYQQMLEQIVKPDVQILDARDAAQFSGAKRRGPRGGHIPGAWNIPRERFFADSGGFLPLEQTRERLREAGIRPDKPVIAYCNGGVAATVILFNLHRLGFTNIANYDGSWNEWGSRLDLPAEQASDPTHPGTE